MRTLAPFLLFALLSPFTSALEDIECGDNDLANYLISVIDTTYDNGLTIFEQFITAVVETEAGYAFLESLHDSDEAHTLLAPTDEAFNKVGLAPPFGNMGDQRLADLLSFHILSDTWTYDKLPQTPTHAITSTQLGLKAHLNRSVNTSAQVAMILQQGDGGNVAVRLAVGNGTTWDHVLDLSWAGITNLVVLPVDTVSNLTVT